MPGVPGPVKRGISAKRGSGTSGLGASVAGKKRKCSAFEESNGKSIQNTREEAPPSVHFLGASERRPGWGDKRTAR